MNLNAEVTKMGGKTYITAFVSCFFRCRILVSKSIKQCQAMQILRQGIADKNLEFYDSLLKVANGKQSDCVPTYDSCAIVGNSGILLGSECGDVIDSADFVIRLNVPRIGGRYKVDVGARVDATSVNLELNDNLARCAGVRKYSFLPKGWTQGWTRTLNCTDLMDRMKIFNKGGIFWIFKRYREFGEMKSVLAALRNTYKLNFTLAYSPVSPMTAAQT